MDVKVLSPNSELSFVSAWYDLADDGHFWMQGRLFALLKQMELNAIPRDSKLKGLEIGCGHGVLRGQVERHTQWSIDGADLDLASLKSNPAGRGDVFLYNVFDQRHEFKDHYDFIFLYDVIEHIEDVNAFMQACLFHLKPGGLVFINVPALKSLFSKYDQVVGHVRRYDKAMMRDFFEVNKLKTVDIKYWGLLFVPLLFVRKMFIARDTSQSTIVNKGFKPANSWINSLFKLFIKTEVAIIPNPFLGASVMAIARKV